MMKWKVAVCGTALLVSSAFCGALAQADDLEAILNAASDPVGTLQVTNQRMAHDWFIRQFPTSSVEQMVVGGYIERGDWSNAILTWDRIVKGTALEKSETGQAFFSWMLFESGLKVAGMESLWSIAKPEKIDSIVTFLWQGSAPISNPAWSAAQITYSPAWGKIFPGLEPQLRMRTLSGKVSVAELNKVTELAPQGSMLQAKAQWNLVVAMALDNQAGPAAKELAQLMVLSNKPVSMDLMNLTAGRLLYQNSYLDAAIRYYSKVPKTSDLWIEAREEMSWAYLRKGDLAHAITVSNDLLHPSFIGLVSPESDLINSVAKLRICDYSGVLKNVGSFAERFRARYARLREIEGNSNDATVLQVLSQLEKGRVDTKSLGPILQKMPRFTLRDDSLYGSAQQRAILSNELAQLGKILNKVTAATVISERVETLKKNLTERELNAKNAAVSRVQWLASREADEIHNALKKMNIVEAEIIERINLPVSQAAKAVQPNEITIAKSRNILEFPADGEVWFDEIGGAQMEIKKVCVR